eukprot:GHVO01050433.1.p1 GENE.GHVO01050433.1~~GHVO01050433.1.p1  ORF type:complete len:236 (+),score=46.61 GHVO01050433.1:844-1551(+)
MRVSYWQRLPGSANGDLDSAFCQTLKSTIENLESSVTAPAPMGALVALAARYPQFRAGRGGGSKSSMAEAGQMQSVPGSMPTSTEMIDAKEAESGQHDAEECMMCIIESLRSACMPRGAIDTEVQVGFEYTLKCMECEDEPETKATETAFKLSCYVGGQVTAVDRLDQGLWLSLKQEVEKHSPILGRNAKFQKQLRICSLPKSLIIHFVRFEWKAAQTLAMTKAGRAKVLRVGRE